MKKIIINLAILCSFCTACAQCYEGKVTEIKPHTFTKDSVAKSFIVTIDSCHSFVVTPTKKIQLPVIGQWVTFTGSNNSDRFTRRKISSKEITNCEK